MKKSRYLLGVFFIVIVSFLWVISGILTKQILDDNSHPFLVTYSCTSAFAIYLVIYLPFLFNQCKSVQGERNTTEVSITDREGMNDLLIASDTSVNGRHLSLSPDKDERPPFDELRSINGEASDAVTCCYCCVKKQSSNRLPLYWTLKLSLIFCFIWFGMNYFYNYSLGYTVVGSSTVLSSLSGPFSLILSTVLLKEPVVWSNVLGVAVVMGGAVLIGVYEHDKDQESSNPILGDSMAIVSAFLYGCFSTLMKFFIKDESKISMTLFFGLIGLCNIICLWPLFFILSWVKNESMTMPDDWKTIGLIALTGFIGVLSDYLWARSIFLTSPIIATVGLCLTNPIAVLYDYFHEHVHKSRWYYCGIVTVIVGFLLVNLKAARKLERENNLQNSDYAKNIF